jgi:hypothetical protein
MGLELEWFILLLICVIGKSIFNRFELETPVWRLILKWLITIAITYGLYVFGGHSWALGFIFGFLFLAISVHFLWCKYHDIHPLNATPQEKYYALRGWSSEKQMNK